MASNAQQLFQHIVRRPESAKKYTHSAFSPALEAVEYLDVKFNGSVYHQSIYKGQPNPELDAAWDKLVFRTKPTPISSEILHKLKKSDSPSLVKFPDEDGRGYHTTLELTHEIHCLNMLRKATYYEYYEATDPAIQEGPVYYRLHLDHCIEMLRQRIMCTGDVGLITSHWVKGHKLPYPDFNTWHRCRNVDKIWAWNDEHAVHIPWSHLVRSGDAVDLEEAP